jgi:hypothetical protein
MKKALFAIMIIIILGYVVYSNTGDRALAPAGESPSTNNPGEVENENGGTQNGRVVAPASVALKVGESQTPAFMPTITLNKVTEDSRCPANANCIWAGSISADITLSTDDANSKKDLNISSDDEPVLYEGFHISITSASPEAQAGKTISQNDYEIIFYIKSAYGDTVDNPASGTVPAGGSACANMGGTLDAIHGECLGIDANACQEIGGTFNECASACRNDPNAEVCTMQCVQVCEV